MSISSTASQSLRRQHFNPKTDLKEGQADFTVKSSNKGAGTLKEMQAKLEEQEATVFKVLIKSAQNPSFDKESGNMAQEMLSATGTIANLKAAMVQTEATMRASDAQTSAALTQSGDMVGREIKIDDSVRNFAGKPVTFNYNILGKNIPTNAVIQSQISVMTEDGKKKIFSSKNSGGKVGENSFLWDGKDEKGKIVAEGNYTIQVSASYTAPGREDRIKLRTDTDTTAVVAEVLVTDYKSSLITTDGKRVEMSSLKSMLTDKSDSVKTQSETEAASDLMQYFGKDVEFVQDTIDFGGGKTDVSFIAPNELKNATVQIKFYDKSGKKFLAYAENVQNVKKGQNSFTWNGWNVQSQQEFKDITNNITKPSYLENGTYTYKVTLVSSDEKTPPQFLDNKYKHKVDSVDVASGVIEAGGYKFTTHDVKKISEIKIDETPKASSHSLWSEGANMTGKTVIFKDTLRYDGKESVADNFSIEPLPAGETLVDATVTISDMSGNKVATITKKDNDLYASDAEPVPKSVLELNTSSRSIVKKWFAQSFPKSDYAQPSNQQSTAIDQFISLNFRKGTLFKDVYDTLDDTAKYYQRLKNMGLVYFIWDGKSTEGIKMPAGNYSYSVEYSAKKADGTTYVTKLIDQTHGRIATSFIDNGELVFEIADDYGQIHNITRDRLVKVG